jgi:hypothetical protein
VIFKAVVLAWSVICILGCVGGLGLYAKYIDPGAFMLTWAAGLGVMFWFFVWAAVVVPVALVGILFKKTP